MQRLPGVESASGQIPLVASRAEVAGHAYELLHPRSVDELIDEEEFGRDERLPYWAELWPSGRVLADRVAEEEGSGRRFLELGCGIGLASLVALRGGFETFAADYYQAAVELIQENARRNGLSGLDARMIDWRSLPPDLGQFDLVAASDVLYERPNVPLVADAFARLLVRGGLGLVTDPGRRHAEAFPELCRERGLTCTCVARVPMTHGTSRPTIDLYELHWQANETGFTSS